MVISATTLILDDNIFFTTWNDDDTFNTFYTDDTTLYDFYTDTSGTTFSFNRAVIDILYYILLC